MTAAVDVVFPCLDEARALPGVLSALPAGMRAIVVDNGSTDGSAPSPLRMARSWAGEVVLASHANTIPSTVRTSS